MTKISVIVPTYKTAKYLPKCLDNILGQTFQDFEIIIVSDGPDEDHKIVDDYAKKDNRIKVIKDIGKGLGGARNAGIKASKAPYLCSIDSDDWIEPTYLEKMYQGMILDETIDIVQCGTNIVFEGDVDETLKKNDDNYFSIEQEGKVELSNNIFGNINVGTWNKLYKKEIIQKYNLNFPEKMRNEDAYFTWAYWSVCRNMYCIPEKLYNYLRRKDSLMAQTFAKGMGEEVLDHLKVGEMLYDFLVKNNLFEQKKDAFWRAYKICWWFVRDNGDEKRIKKAHKKIHNFLKTKNCPNENTELTEISEREGEKIKMGLKKIMQSIFSLKNENEHKVLRFLGFKLKLKKSIKIRFDNYKI